jgi:hypothetical protein
LGHGLRHIAGLSGLSLLTRARTIVRHHSGILRDTLVGKGGLHEATLALVYVAFAIEESFTQKLFADVSPSGFDKGPMMRHQYIADGVRMRHQHNALRPEAK